MAETHNRDRRPSPEALLAEAQREGGFMTAPASAPRPRTTSRDS